MATNSAAICGCWRSHSSTKTDCDLAPRTFSSAAMRLGEKASEKLTFFCSASRRGRLIDNLHTIAVHLLQPHGSRNTRLPPETTPLAPMAYLGKLCHMYRQSF